MEQPVGFDVTLKPTEFVSSLNAADAGNFDAFNVGWSGRVDPDGNIYGFVATPGTLNDSGYSNPKLDYILNGARKSVTEKSRITLYTAAMKIIHRDRPLIYLYHPVNYYGVTEEGRQACRCTATASSAPTTPASRSRRRARRDHGRLPPAQDGSRPDRPRRWRACSCSLGVRALPGDPALALGGENRDPAVLAQIRHDYGLDQPLPVQYVDWVGHVVQRRPRRRPAQAPRRAHDRHAPADHARARGARRRCSGRLIGHRRRGDRGGPARARPPTTRRPQSRSSACPCRTSGSAC